MGKRYDKRHRLLRSGESERKDGYYMYRWTSRDGKRHSISAKTLDELREKEDEIQRDKSDGIRVDSQNVTVNDLFELWKSLKRGIRDTTFQNYNYMYSQFVADDIGKTTIRMLKRSDVKRFYNKLMDECGLKIATIDNIHTVLHQVLQLAVEDNYVRTNVSDNLLKELKTSHHIGDEHKRALTVPEEELFKGYLIKEDVRYHHWYPIFTVMGGTGMRVGEICGLRWDDIDLEEGMINVDHTLVYYNHAVNGCYFNIHKTKTEKGERQIPMLDEVKEAFLMEKAYQEYNHLECRVTVDGYTNFIFINRFGNVQHQGTLNKALRRIIRDCNDEQLSKGGEKNRVLLPKFSCHSLRHTFTTRLVEAGVNIKVIQELLGHSRSDVTLDIYTTVTKELKQREFGNFEEKLKKQREDWGNRLDDTEDDDEEE